MATQELEKRVRAHYTQELNPTVFELLDEVNSYRKVAKASGQLHVQQLQENARQRAAIEEAPHDRECSIHPPGLEAAHHRLELKYNGVQQYCDCWKSKALESSDE